MVDSNNTPNLMYDNYKMVLYYDHLYSNKVQVEVFKFFRILHMN